jgi:hypothetical protein
MTKDTLICLSSGLTPQYRLDILRLMALPMKTEIQFRYDEDLIEAKLRVGLDANEMKNAEALLCYLDCSADAPPEGQICSSIPCRHGVLIDSTRIGHYFMLRFRLEDFADCPNLSSFESRTKASNPRWKREQESRRLGPIGLWCFYADLAQTCGRSSSAETWQSIIASLWQKKDFAEEEFFFKVEGIFERGRRSALSAHKGEFTLRGAKDYEVKIFHFHPRSDAQGTGVWGILLIVRPGSNDLGSITSPSLPVDSSYDLKSFHIRSSSNVVTQYTSLTIRFENEKDGAILASQPQLFLPMRVVPSFTRLFVSTFLIAGLLFLQQWISASAKGPIDWHTTSVLGALAVLTAVAAVYSLKKPL